MFARLDAGEARRFPEKKAAGLLRQNAASNADSVTNHPISAVDSTGRCKRCGKNRGSRAETKGTPIHGATVVGDTVGDPGFPEQAA